MPETDMSALALDRNDVKGFIGGELQGDEVSDFMKWAGSMLNKGEVLKKLKEYRENGEPKPGTETGEVDDLAHLLKELPGQGER